LKNEKKKLEPIKNKTWTEQERKMAPMVRKCVIIYCGKMWWWLFID